jgi:hypothetical protein
VNPIGPIVRARELALKGVMTPKSPLATMPKVTIHEHGDAFTGEDHIGTARHVLDAHPEPSSK